MEISVDRRGHVSVVTVSGDVDAATAPDLRQWLDEMLKDGQTRLVIDLSQVKFMDSSGLATLVQVFKRVRAGNGEVRLCSLQPPVRRIFELTRLDRAFDIFATRDEAVTSLA